jgi:rhamnosyltransferase
VSYNGLQKIRWTVEALRMQVGHVHIVDNGSGTESLAVLAENQRLPGVSVERLGENRGVGHALNRGVECARQMRCAWLLTMDQDSVVDGSLMAAYRAAIAQDPELVCLAPRITSREREKEKVGGEIRYAITSGNLVRVSLYDKIGCYDEGFFIDCIDFDFCLRVRRAGHAIHRVPEALMQHELGDPVDVPAALRGFYALHPPVRRYYMYRNFMYMAERYLLRFPGFIVKLAIGQMILLLLIGFFDPRPLASYRLVARGLWDWAARKQGPYAGRA